MSQASDLVTLSRFDVRLSPDSQSYIQSTPTRPQPGKRLTKQDVRWQREYRHLGGGTFGQVYLEKCMEADRTQERRAVKRIAKIGRIDYKRELEALAVLSYKSEYQDFFVNFIGWYETDKHICIAMEFHELGSLDDHLVPAAASLPESEVKVIIFQVLKALNYMHELDLMHRDLKPANVLVVATGPEWWIKLADFGFSKRAISNHVAAHTGGGTPLYMAPEMQGVIRDDTYVRSARVTYTKAVDIWAVGVMTFQILAGRTPFRSGDVEKYIAGKLRFPARRLRKAGASDEACDFVRSLITPQPNRRPDARECLRNYWFQARTRLPDDPDYSSHSDSEEAGLAEELPEASATWSSEQASQMKTSAIQTSGLVASNTLPAQPDTAETEPTVCQDTSAVAADDATIKATESIAPDQHATSHALDVSVTDASATGDVRGDSRKEEAPVPCESQLHSPLTHTSNRPVVLPKDLSAANQLRSGLEPLEGDAPDDTIKPNATLHGQRRPQLPEPAQDSSSSSRDQARRRSPSDVLYRTGVTPKESHRPVKEHWTHASREPPTRIWSEQHNGHGAAAHEPPEATSLRSFTDQRRRMQSHEKSARDYIERSRRLSPPRVSPKDKVEYIRRSEGRPSVSVRRGPRELRPTSPGYNYPTESETDDEFPYPSIRRSDNMPNHEPARRISPARVSTKDKVEYIKRSEGRPAVMVRRRNGKPQKEDNDVDEPLHREFDRERRPYASQASFADDLEDYVSSNAESYEMASGRSRKITRTPSPVRGRGRVATSPYPRRRRQTTRSPYPMRERSHMATPPHPSSARTTYLYTPQGLRSIPPGRPSDSRGGNAYVPRSSDSMPGDDDRPPNGRFGNFGDPKDIFAEFLRGGSAGKSTDDANAMRSGYGGPTSGGAGMSPSNRDQPSYGGFAGPSDTKRVFAEDIFAEFMRGGGASKAEDDANDDMFGSDGRHAYSGESRPRPRRHEAQEFFR